MLTENIINQGDAITILGIKSTCLGNIAVCTVSKNKTIQISGCMVFKHLEIVGHHSGTCIVYDEDYYNELSDDEKQVIYNHEIGHLVLGHLDKDFQSMHFYNLVNLELNADIFSFFESGMSAKQYHFVLKSILNNINHDGLNEQQIKTMKMMKNIRLMNVVGLRIGEAVAKFIAKLGNKKIKSANSF